MLCPGLAGFAQDYASTLPPVGSQLTDFTLSIQKNGRSVPKAVPLSAYRGKWLVMEFWGKYCTVCISGFPKMESFRKKFADRANFLLIASDDKKRGTGIRSFYARFRDELGLGFDTGYDSLALEKFGVQVLPTLLVVSPDGTVVHRTTSNKIDQLGLEAIFNGKNPWNATDTTVFAIKRITDSISPLPHQALLGPGTYDRSQVLRLNLSSGTKNGVFKTSPIQLGMLYQLAYLGRASWIPMDEYAARVYHHPVLEMADTSAFIYRAGTLRGLYRYELSMADPNSNTGAVQRAIQADLAKWFPYEVVLEKREMPVLKLIIVDTVKVNALASSAGKMERNGDSAGMRLTGATSEQLVRFFRSYFPFRVIQDESGIKFPINLQLNAAMTDLASVSRSLQQSGMDLVRSTSVVEVLVIRDKQ